MTITEDLAYFRDERVTRGPAKLPELDGEPLPHEWVVCPVCRGKGTHVNPSIDAHGLSAEDFADDPDFAEEYVSGHYDVTCNHCNGRTTVPVVDLSRCSFAQKRLMAAQRREARWAAEARAEQLAEISRGA